jgi:hypothetical protein
MLVLNVECCASAGAFNTQHSTLPFPYYALAAAYATVVEECRAMASLQKKIEEC